MNLINVENQNKKTQNRIYYLDVLRFIACLSVIMIHASSSYVMKDIPSSNFWIGNIFDAISRIAVPVFVMISGALMLDKHYQYSKEKLIKHLKKMLVCFIFWSLFYVFLFNIIFGVIINHQQFDLMKNVVSVFEGYYHLWFFYLIIGLYLIVPLLRLWVKDENKKHVQYYLVLALIFTYLLPEIISIGSCFSDTFQKINVIFEEKLCLKYVGGFTAYFITGWYLKNYDLKNRKIVYLFGIFSILISIFGTYFLSVKMEEPVILLYKNITINVFLQSAMVFVFIKEKYNKLNICKNKFIMCVSKYSLGVYVMHAMIVTIMYNVVFPRLGLDEALLCIPLVFFLSFGISLLGSFIFNKISFLRRFV